MPIEVETDEKGKRKCVTKTEKWNNFSEEIFSTGTRVE